MVVIIGFSAERWRENLEVEKSSHDTYSVKQVATAAKDMTIYS